MKAYEYWITDSLAEFKKEKTISKVNVMYGVKIVCYNSNVLFQTNRILYKKLYFLALFPIWVGENRTSSRILPFSFCLRNFSLLFSFYCDTLCL